MPRSEPMTEEQLDNWERKLRYEIEVTILETRDKLRADPSSGHFSVWWTKPEAFEA